MVIQKKTIDENVIVSPEGIIDTSSAGEFEDSMKEVVSTGKHVIVDFSKVDFISSSGLRVLLIVLKSQTKPNITLTNLSQSVREVFELTGFIDLFDIK